MHIHLRSKHQINLLKHKDIPNANPCLANEAKLSSRVTITNYSSYFDPMPSVSTIKKLIERMLLRLDKLPEGMLERVGLEAFHIFIDN